LKNMLIRPLNFSWLETALGVWVEIEELNARRAIIHNMTREIIAICRTERERVEKAEAFLDKYAHVIPHAEKQEIFRLMAEALLFITYNGVRIRCTDDPKRLLQGG